MIHTQYLCDGVPLVAAEGGWTPAINYPFVMAASITFERASVEYSSRNKPRLVVYEGDAKEPAPVEVPSVSGYHEEARYFAQCLLEGKPPDRIPPGDAARAVAIVEAEERSVRTGRPVTLS